MDKKEVRSILIGRLVRLDERLWAAASSDAKVHFHGIRDGAGDVFLFGVTHLTRCYQVTEMEPDIAFTEAETVLNAMGRPIQLTSAPKEKACLYAPNWIAPVLLSINQEDAGLQLTAYTGRSLFIGQLRCRIALWILEQRLPEGITRLNTHQKPQKQPAEKPPKKTPAAETPPKTTTREVSQKKKSAPKRLKKKAPPKRLKK